MGMRSLVERDQGNDADGQFEAWHNRGHDLGVDRSQNTTVRLSRAENGSRKCTW
jgi:hypothetical protein